MEVSKELRADIERNQTKLKNAIRNHQLLLFKLNSDRDNEAVKGELKAAQADIISIGLDQKELIARVRKELKIYEKDTKAAIKKEILDERKSNLVSLINKSRKQNLTNRSASISSSISNSDESLQDAHSSPPSPAPPLFPHELTQIDFLARMGLCTHDVFKELQNKRVERKRRSTANPQFLYGNRWDYNTKRRKNAYLISMSPPNTRQAMKNKLKEQQQQEKQRVSPPLSSQSQRSDSRSSSPLSNSNATQAAKKQASNGVPIGLNIPNLPSGLTIERINGNKQSAENKVCLVCRAPGALTICDSCGGSFHVRCHNRPLVSPPRQCPKCLGRKDSSATRDVGSLSVPPSMTVLTSYVPAEVKEKEQEKRSLLEKNLNLRTELSSLEERAEQLTVSLQDQRGVQTDMLDKQKKTQQNIQRLLDFISTMQGKPPPHPAVFTPASPTPPPCSPTLIISSSPNSPDSPDSASPAFEPMEVQELPDSPISPPEMEIIPTSVPSPPSTADSNSMEERDSAEEASLTPPSPLSITNVPISTSRAVSVTEGS